MNPWKILHVHRKSSDAEIRDAFYKIAKHNHPDVQKYDHNTPLADYGSEEFVQASLAFAAIETVKTRRKFLDKVMADDCTKCKGTGTISKSKGLTTKTHTACNGCGGAGLIIKEKKDDGIIELRGAGGIGSKGSNKKRRT